MTIRDGGPAFPGVVFQYDRDADASGRWPYIPESVSGASLRDYFAGQVMPALAFAAGQDGTCDTFGEYMRKTDLTARELLAATAYQMADAMLKAREKGESDDR